MFELIQKNERPSMGSKMTEPKNPGICKTTPSKTQQTQNLKRKKVLHKMPVLSA